MEMIQRITRRIGDLPLIIFIGIVLCTSENLRRNYFDANGNSQLNEQVSMNYDVIPSKEERMPVENIRFATFGTSIAWGSTLENREEDAFIFQLSPNARNFAIRATGSEYPAACLSSMIGDEVFDVIVLEFSMRVKRSTIRLAKRLRQRFPDALIISLRNWTPVQMKSKMLHNKNLRKIASENGFPPGGDYIHDPAFHKIVKESATDWKIDWMDLERNNEKMKLESGVFSATLSSEDKYPLQWLSEVGRFADDSFHLSKEGHTIIAKRIMDIVEREGVPAQPRLNNFDGEDHCQNWYLSGYFDESLSHSPSGFLHQLTTNANKFALSFKDGFGTITVYNPADRAQDLYISSMTMGPDKSPYPITAIKMDDTDHKAITVDPQGSLRFMQEAYHIPKQVYVGKIKPGPTTVYFTELERTDYRFSLVAYAITPVKMVDLIP